MPLAVAFPTWTPHPDVWLLVGLFAAGYVIAVVRLGPVTAVPGQPVVTRLQMTSSPGPSSRSSATPRPASSNRRGFAVGETGARGDADKVTFVGPDLYEILRGRVTTCVAPREDWFLRAEKIDIDTVKKVGVARDARLDFMGVPILYSPWLEFPLSRTIASPASSRRRSARPARAASTSRCRTTSIWRRTTTRR